MIYTVEIAYIYFFFFWNVDAVFRLLGVFHDVLYGDYIYIRELLYIYIFNKLS